MRTPRATLRLLILAACAAACSPAAPGDADPIASLEAAEPSATYTAEYWDGEAEAGSETWEEALRFCREESRELLPNCRTVSQVHFLRKLRESAKRTSKPYDGKTGAPLPDLVVRTLETGTEPPAPRHDRAHLVGHLVGVCDVRVGVKLFVLYLLIGIGMSLPETWMAEPFGEWPNPRRFFEVMGGALIFAMIVWRVPQLAASMLGDRVGFFMDRAFVDDYH